MYKNRVLDSYRAWKQIRDMSLSDSRTEFYIMKNAVTQEVANLEARKSVTRFVWMDFFTYVALHAFIPASFKSYAPN